MRIVKELAKRIKEELHDAEWYAKAAIEHKVDQPTVAATYHRLASEELGHAGMLHDDVVKMIKAYDKPVPPVMAELWAWQHEEIVEEEAEVRRLIDMYMR